MNRDRYEQQVPITTYLCTAHTGIILRTEQCGPVRFQEIMMSDVVHRCSACKIEVTDGLGWGRWYCAAAKDEMITVNHLQDRHKRGGGPAANCVLCRGVHGIRFPCAARGHAKRTQERCFHASIRQYRDLKHLLCLTQHISFTTSIVAH